MAAASGCGETATESGRVRVDDESQRAYEVTMGLSSQVRHPGFKLAWASLKPAGLKTSGASLKHSTALKNRPSLKLRRPF